MKYCLMTDKNESPDMSWPQFIIGILVLPLLVAAALGLSAFLKISSSFKHLFQRRF